MSAHVLLNLLNELRKRDKTRVLSSILSLFRNKFNKLNYPMTRPLPLVFSQSDAREGPYSVWYIFHTSYYFRSPPIT